MISLCSLLSSSAADTFRLRVSGARRACVLGTYADPYRTNEGFIGHIVSLNRQQSLVEFEAWHTSTQPTPEMAAIVVDESLMRAELLADLVLMPQRTAWSMAR